jgi:DNA-binding Lrp family transcriptional regulator
MQEKGMKKEILKLMEKNSRIDFQDVADMLDTWLYDIN